MSRLEDIQKGGATLVMHLNYGNGYGYVYRCIAEPRITLGYGGPKGRKSKFERYRRFLVEGIEDEFSTLEEAVEAVEKLDRTNKDELEWDKAAPKPKRPPPLILEGE